MERDVTYIREELEEVMLSQLRRWEDVLEQEELTTLEASGIDELPNLMAHLNEARDALVQAEGVLVQNSDFTQADVVLGFPSGGVNASEAERAADVALRERAEEELLARFTSSGEIKFVGEGDERSYNAGADRERV